MTRDELKRKNKREKIENKRKKKKKGKFRRKDKLRRKPKGDDSLLNKQSSRGQRATIKRRIWPKRETRTMDVSALTMCLPSLCACPHYVPAFTVSLPSLCTWLHRAFDGLQNAIAFTMCVSAIILRRIRVYPYLFYMRAFHYAHTSAMLPLLCASLPWLCANLS